jgi:hypothetical protein
LRLHSPYAFFFSSQALLLRFSILTVDHGLV